MAKVVNRVEPDFIRQAYFIEAFKGVGLVTRQFARNIFARKDTATVQYPEEKKPYTARFRGRHRLMRRDDAQAVEITYFGLVPDFIGRGYGGALLTDALQRAWAWGAQRGWVHTCTLDHAAALKNYQARGMQVYDRKSHPTDLPD